MDSTNTVNPYETPDASIEISGANPYQNFDRLSAWFVWLLAMFTGGIYSLYFIFSRANRVNTVVDNKITAFWPVTMVLSYIAYFAIAVIAPEIPTAGWGIAIMVVALTSVITSIGCVFKIRNRLNQINQQVGNGVYLGPILTFFFNVIYLAYKINQAKDLAADQE